MTDRTELSPRFGMRFLILGYVLVFSDWTIMGADVNDLRPIFERHYQLWKAHCKEVESSSRIEDRLDSPDYRAIVSLGPPVIPYIIDKIGEDPAFIWIGWAWGTISRVIPDPKIYPWTPEPVLDWWQRGKRQANARFEGVYGQWKDLTSQGRSKEASHCLKTVRAMGTAVLPSLMKKLTVTDGDLLQTIEDITGGTADTSGNTPEERVKSCLSWWARSKENWLIPFPNKRPVANAGKGMTVATGDTAQLDGSASSDADKDGLTYNWRQVAGPAVVLSQAASAKPTFIAPQVQRQTTVTFELIVEDGSPKKSVHPSCESGQSNPDTVNVIVKPKG